MMYSTLLLEYAPLLHVLPIGLLLGSIYAVSFVIQQRRLFFLSAKKYPATIALTLIRMMLIALSSYYLLHLPSTRLILVGTLAFIAGFWLVIISKRALPYERI